MDAVIVSEKLESLRRCVTRVQEKMPPDTHQLASDADLQDIVVLNLTRASQLSVEIGSHVISATDEAAPESMGSVFGTLMKLEAISPDTDVAMTKVVGFRNVAVHNYTAIDWEIVFAICEKSLCDFRQFAKEIHRSMNSMQ